VGRNVPGRGWGRCTVSGLTSGAGRGRGVVNGRRGTVGRMSVQPMTNTCSNVAGNVEKMATRWGINRTNVPVYKGPPGGWCGCSTIHQEIPCPAVWVSVQRQAAHRVQRLPSTLAVTSERHEPQPGGVRQNVPNPGGGVMPASNP